MRASPTRSVTKRNRHPNAGCTNPPPSLFIRHAERSAVYDRGEFEAIVHRALPLCVQCAEPNSDLLSLQKVDITVIGKRRMADIHREHLGIPGPTDVITFPYGDVLVCAQVARERAKEFGLTTTRELSLYAIHGLLHLAGYTDKAPASARRMAVEQSRILSAVCDKIAKPLSGARDL